MTVPPRPQPTQTPIAALILRSVLAAILEAVRPVSRLKKLARPQRLFKTCRRSRNPVAGGVASAVGFTRPLVGGGNSVPQGWRRRWWSMWRSTHCENSV
jgi:hypothetical protein